MIEGYKDARCVKMYIMKYEDLLNTVTDIAVSYERDVSTYGDKQLYSKLSYGKKALTHTAT